MVLNGLLFKLGLEEILLFNANFQYKSPDAQNRPLQNYTFRLL
jgi:hypothetical protein